MEFISQFTARRVSRYIALISIALLLPAPLSAKTVKTGLSVSGEVIFACDFKVDLMQANGFRFSGEGTNGEFKTSFFGLPDVDVVIKSSTGEIIGLSKSKTDGTFSVQLPKSPFYQLSVDYRGRKIEQVVAAADAANMQRISVGYFGAHQKPCEIN